MLGDDRLSSVPIHAGTREPHITSPYPGVGGVAISFLSVWVGAWCGERSHPAPHPKERPDPHYAPTQYASNKTELGTAQANKASRVNTTGINFKPLSNHMGTCSMILRRCNSLDYMVEAMAREIQTLGQPTDLIGSVRSGGGQSSPNSTNRYKSRETKQHLNKDGKLCPGQPGSAQPHVVA
ncbi:hypothetical protein VTK56DRAFT_4550 [Thermocarpiscus australiensis]